MINIGLPKGVVKEKSLKLIENFSKRKLDKDILNYEINGIRFILLKHRDIARLVDDGTLDYGITSVEWLEELNTDVNIIAETEWCNTRISLISPAHAKILEKNKVKCISEFPYIAKRFFNSLENIKFTVDFVSGSSEALVDNIYDCCVDCVETGKTLQKNNLKEEKIILKSKMVFIQTKKRIYQNKEIDRLIRLLYE